MPQLTAEQLETLASRPKVRRIAVLNFLPEDSSEPLRQHLGNLAQDARDYGWNAPTQAAIRKGLSLIYGRKV